MSTPTTCTDCGHVHTATGCAGPPTPSDLWAGVSVSTCDCIDDPMTPRPPCSHCPPGCRSCWAPDCECYDHQDWPDTRFEPALVARLARCIDGSGCDGRSHGIDCNNQLYATPAAPTTEGDTHA